MSIERKENQDINALEVIEFFVDEKLEDGTESRTYYGMNVAKVLEIIQMPEVTVVPGQHHPAALGTFSMRGQVLPLVDLVVWMEKEPVKTGKEKVIVSEFSGVVTAFIVSGVTRIHRMTWAKIEPPGKYIQTFSQDSVIGILRLENRILFLLDMEFIIGTMAPSMSLESHAKLEGEKGERGKGHRVLVVDDSPSVRTVISSCMKHEDYEVVTATSGAEAWDLLQKWLKEAQEEGKDITDYLSLIISDIEMPEIDGHTLTRMIKGESAFNKIPVILFSAIISDVVRGMGDHAGADDQVAKPDLPVLAERASDLIAEFRAK